MARSERPRKLGEVLESLVERLGIRRELDHAEIVEAWAALAGPDINKVTESAWLRGNKLFVKITSPSRRQQLHLNRSHWRELLNEALGKQVVEEILFR